MELDPDEPDEIDLDEIDLSKLDVKLLTLLQSANREDRPFHKALIRRQETFDQWRDACGARLVPPNEQNHLPEYFTYRDARGAAERMEEDLSDQAANPREEERLRKIRESYDKILYEEHLYEDHDE